MRNALPPPIPVLLLGFGYASRVFHAPLIRAAKGLVLTAVVSSSAAKVQAELPGMTVFSTLDAALESLPGGILVVIATPNETHAPLALRALRRGCHVVVDKPFTVSLDEARALQAEAVRAGRLLSVFQNRRWDGDFLTLRGLLAKRALGQVTLYQSRFDRFRPEVRPRWREQDVPGGGIWCDLGPHLADQALCLFGLPLSVQAQIRTLRPGALIDDHFEVSLRYPERMVQLSASMLLAGGLPRFAVHGTAGSWITHGLDGQEAQLLGQAAPAQSAQQIDATGRVQPCRLLGGRYPVYYESIAAAIAIDGQHANPVPAIQAIAVMAVIEAGLLSARSGRQEALALSAEERSAYRDSQPVDP